MRIRKHMSSSHYNVNWNNHYHKNNSEHWKKLKIFLQSYPWNPSWQGCIKKWYILYQLNFNYTFPVRVCKLALILKHSQICPMPNVKFTANPSLFTANSNIWNFGKIQVWYTSWFWMFKNVLIEVWFQSVLLSGTLHQPSHEAKSFGSIGFSSKMCKLQLSHWTWVSQKAEWQWCLTSSELEQQDLKWPRNKKLAVVLIKG